MDAKEFVRGVRKVVMEGALDDVLEELSQPSVITPASREEDLRAWYASLQAPDREMLAFALEEAVDAAVFGLLAVIDGVRSVEDPEVTGKLELWYEHSSGRRLLSGKLHELLYSMEGPEHCERSGIQAIDHDLAQWEVWRQDDNGNQFYVSGGHTRDEALRVCAELEAHGHQQMYWAVPASPNRA